jgi:predicted TIM-barrel fold metal-dependent hydrolase
LYARVEELGLPMLWHSGTSPYSHPLQIAFVARLFPTIPLILGHFALSDLTWECFPAAELADNIMVDTTANPILPVLDDWLRRFGAERMLWGSDFPFYDVGYELVKLDHMAIDADARRQIACENARRLFRLTDPVRA